MIRNKVIFYPKNYFISNLSDDKVIFKGERLENIYMIDLNELSINDHCLVATQPKINETRWSWHRRLGHASIQLMTKLINNDLVKGISNLSFEENKICDACQLGK